MILFHFETDLKLQNKLLFKKWIQFFIRQLGKKVGEVNYIFCTDEYLHELNVKYLNHDTLTDIITFDYSENNLLHGDIFISIDRVKENSEKFKINFQEELKRVIAHGVLHLAGFKDKKKEDKAIMRIQEDRALELFNKVL
ncbi:MAG: rRNA maturation RNase YbeY [Bacteroidetes bacterium]|nr:rRNA maturation RNase YbeY [Bacteroidota bacterium]